MEWIRMKSSCWSAHDSVIFRVLMTGHLPLLHGHAQSKPAQQQLPTVHWEWQTPTLINRLPPRRHRSMCVSRNRKRKRKWRDVITAMTGTRGDRAVTWYDVTSSPTTTTQVLRNRQHRIVRFCKQNSCFSSDWLHGTVIGKHILQRHLVILHVSLNEISVAASFRRSNCFSYTVTTVIVSFYSF